MRLRSLAFILTSVLLLPSLGCRGQQGREAEEDSTDLAAREARLNQAKSVADTGQWGAPLARWVMPQNMNEISGLALTPDGRLFAHPDERGIVSQIDYRRGVVVKQFLLGRRGVQADFEGIAVAGDTMYLLASNGRIYEFREGANGANVDFSVHDLELGKECEFEGLAYDPAINSLLLACKHIGIEEFKDHLLIYRWRLTDTGGERLSHLAVQVAELAAQHDWKDIGPTGIDVDPVTGNYVLTTMEHALIVVSPEGVILEMRLLPATHDQPEGVAITRDSMIIISDEAVTKPAAITLYRWP